MLNQVWLCINVVQWWLPEGNFTSESQPPITKIRLKITDLKFHSNVSVANELSHCYNFCIILKYGPYFPVRLYLVSNPQTVIPTLVYFWWPRSGTDNICKFVFICLAVQYVSLAFTLHRVLCYLTSKENFIDDTEIFGRNPDQGEFMNMWEDCFNHWGLVMSYGERDLGHHWGNGLMPDSNKPLPEPMLTYHQ